MELAEHNIRVQTVLPGPVKSDIARNAFTEDINFVRKEIILIVLAGFALNNTTTPKHKSTTKVSC